MAAGGRLRRALAPAPFVCAGLNAIAAVLLATAMRPGTEVGGSVAQRAAYISSHELLWRGGWAFWLTASTSLVGFYLWWALRLGRRGALVLWAVAMCGFALDATAELMLATWVPGNLGLAPLASALTGIGANGLYTVAGAGLTLLTGVRGWFAAWTWTMWAAGACLSLSTLVGFFAGSAVSAGVLFLLFCPWVVALRLRLG